MESKKNSQSKNSQDRLSSSRIWIFLVLGLLVQVTSEKVIAGCHSGGGVGSVRPPMEGERSPLACTDGERPICALLWYQSVVNTTTPAQFVVKFTDVDDVAIENFRITMTRSDSKEKPLVLTAKPLFTNSFQVTGARFPATGDWQVTTQFQVQGRAEKIQFEFPVLN